MADKSAADPLSQPALTFLGSLGPVGVDKAVTPRRICSCLPYLGGVRCEREYWHDRNEERT
jgi:hypothetical protein